MSLSHILLFVGFGKIRDLVDKFIGWKIHIMVPCLLLKILLLVGPKDCYNHEIGVWIARKIYTEKYTLYDLIPWEYLGKPMNFSAIPHKCNDYRESNVQFSLNLFTAMSDSM